MTNPRNGAQGDPATGLVTRFTITANGRARARLTAPARKSSLRQIHEDRIPEQGGPGCEGGALEHQPIQRRGTSVVRCDVGVAARHAASVPGAVHRVTAGKDPLFGAVAQQVERAAETREAKVRCLPAPQPARVLARGCSSRERSARDASAPPVCRRRKRSARPRTTGVMPACGGEPRWKANGLEHRHGLAGRVEFAPPPKS